MFLSIFENIINSLESIKSNKLRSSLSMLWIIIWVASVIILTAIWNWSQQSIVSKIEELWTNILTISAWWRWWVNDKWFSKDFLNEKLVTFLKENTTNIKSILPVISWNWQLIYNSNNMNSSVMWITTDYIQAKNWKISSWLNFTKNNIENLDKVAIIWNEVYSELFWTQDPIWKKIKMWNNVFEVIWVLEENSNFDSYIFIPISTASVRIFWQKYYSQVIVIVQDANIISQTQEDINNLLIKKLEITDTENLPYRIRNNSQMLQNMSSITWTLTMLLSWIAWISLLVWWIWVMNIMLVSVTERTKEIWIRKAIWAWKSDILIQFLTEASCISLIWWFIWIAFSYFVVYILNNLIWLTAVISINSIYLSFWFSLFIWIVFWLLPAYKAAKLRPIDALRFE